MIAFVTLFLGLVAGHQVVGVAVSGPVVTVELRLDGELASSLSGEPWRTKLDFGAELTTHELVAVARDAAGAEVGRAVQQINVPRSSVEAEILLDDWQEGRPRSARLIWHSAELREPESIAVSLDGEILVVDDPGQIELPEVDPDSLHFISAELTFPGNKRSSAQSIFGGRYGVEVESELTAVPVVPAKRRLERPQDGRGWLRRPDGEALRVVAVEEDVAEVLIVRDDAALPTLQRLERTLRREKPRSHHRGGLAPADRLFLTSARAVVAAHAEVDYELYPISRSFGLEDVSLPRALAVVEVSAEGTTEQRLSDAVAVAGVRAAAGGRRRAVLLVVSDCAERTGRWTGESVRRFLAELRVPLEVWVTRRLDREAGGFCRGALRLKGTGSYLAAHDRMRRLLAKQQILWVEGRHLPREILLTDAALATEVVQEN